MDILIVMGIQHQGWIIERLNGSRPIHWNLAAGLYKKLIISIVLYTGSNISAVLQRYAREL